MPATENKNYHFSFNTIDIEKIDQERFRALNWGLRTWDQWHFNDVDKRFGDPWPGRIPAQLVAHTLFYFTKQNDLIFDPMAGGAIVADTCLVFDRRCWSFDLSDRLNTRPEIEPFLWDPENAILILEYAKLLEQSGWKITHLIDTPLSTERFTGNMVCHMQKKRTLGIIRRTLIIGKLKST